MTAVLTRCDQAPWPVTTLFLLAATACGDGGSGPQGPNNPAPFPGEGDQGVVFWNDGAEGVSSAGLVGGSRYEVAFSNDSDSEVLRFAFGELVEGEHDLAGADGRMFFKRTYYSTQKGGWARVTLSDAGDNRLQAAFESRTCFKETPDANCFEQRNGRFTVVNNTGQTLQPRNATEVVPGYPMLDAITRTRAVWETSTDGLRTARNRDGVRLSAGIFLLTFEQPSWIGGRYSLRMRSIDVGSYTLDGRTTFSYSAGESIYSYVSDIDGGGGQVDIEGNDGQFMWGTINARTCFSRTPRANCYDFEDIHFIAAIEG